MTYDRIELDVSKEEAKALIARRVDGVRVKRFHDRYEYSSPAGFHLAELSDHTLPDGTEGSRLVYRDSVGSLFSYYAGQLARDIRDAVWRHRV